MRAFVAVLIALFIVVLAGCTTSHDHDGHDHDVPPPAATGTDNPVPISWNESSYDVELLYEGYADNDMLEIFTGTILRGPAANVEITIMARNGTAEWEPCATIETHVSGDYHNHLVCVLPGRDAYDLQSVVAVAGQPFRWHSDIVALDLRP